MLQAARGLEHIHSKNLVHRDVKPANLFLTRPAEQVKILDLGVARVPGFVRHQADTHAKFHQHLRLHGRLSKPASRAVDIRADLYGLGCSFYHVVAGQVPFPADNEADAIVQLHNGDRAHREAPARSLGLAEIIRKLMEKKPDDRYQTPTDLIQALGRIDQTSH